jgi:hypothetical protein
MIKANSARVEWNPEKGHWQVVIQVGAEVVRRQCADTPRDASESELREIAVSTAEDEGYEVDPGNVSVIAAPSTSAAG